MGEHLLAEGTGTASATRVEGYLPTLDGWRVVAVVLVVLFHSSGPGSWGGAPLGALGVDVFFGLSGLLICTRLLQEQRQAGRISLKGFYLRRALRILPASWAFLAVLAVLGRWGVPVTTAELVSCLLFCRNYWPSGHHWYTAHFWSLAVEEHFYLLFPCLFLLIGSRRRSAWMWAGAAVLTALVRALGPVFLASSGGRLPPGTFFWSRTHVRLDALLWGCWAATVLHRHRDFLVRWLRPAVAVILAGGVVASATVPSGHLWRPLFIPCLLVATLLRPSTLWGRVLEWLPVRRLGKLTYSIYLWQQLFCVGQVEYRVAALAPCQEGPVACLALLASAALSYHLLERPLICLGHRLTFPASVPIRDCKQARR